MINKNEIFNAFCEFEQEISRELITRVFILINKYYPSFLIVNADWNKEIECLQWEEFVLNDYVLTSEHALEICLSVPLFIVQNADGNIEFEHVIGGLRIYYGKEESTNNNSFGVNFFGNVYTDIRYEWDKIGEKEISINQSIAAKENRIRMTSFLKDLEKLLDGEITEFLSSFYLDDRYIFKYGIMDEAVLK